MDRRSVCLLLSVSLSPHEFDCRARDCRTTTLRKRDARVSIAANAGRIRLRAKTVVARFVQSPGTSERIRTPSKTKIVVISDN